MEPPIEPQPLEPPPKKRRHRRTKPLEPPQPIQPPILPTPPPPPEEPLFEPEISAPGVETFRLPGSGIEEPPADEMLADLSPLPEIEEYPRPSPVYQEPHTIVFDPAEEKRRKEMLARVRRFKQQFVGLRDFPIPEGASAAELEGIVEQFRDVVSSKNTFALVRSGYLTAVKLVEGLGSKAGMKIYGSADILGQSEQVSTCLKLIIAEHGLGSQMPPEKQLMFTTLATMTAVHSLNARAEAAGKFLEQPVDGEVAARYKDL